MQDSIAAVKRVVRSVCFVMYRFCYMVDNN